MLVDSHQPVITWAFIYLLYSPKKPKQKKKNNNFSVQAVDGQFLQRFHKVFPRTVEELVNPSG